MDLRKFKKIFGLSFFFFFASGVVSAQGNDQLCRQRATQIYNDCLSGGSNNNDNSACRTQTRCEDLCVGGKRICRVFDCRGLILSDYEENCLVQAPTFSCSECALDQTDPGNHNREKWCFKVWDLTNGQRKLVAKECTKFEYDYSANDRCNDLKSSDARCGGN